VSESSTIIVAREDFSIPGAAQNVVGQLENSKDERQRFFDLLRESQPDVVVLNLTVTEGRGVTAIEAVRSQSSVPILVVCAQADPLTSDYRSAGAAQCLHPPLDIIELNRSIRNVIRPHSKADAVPHDCEGYKFHGITYRPGQRALAGPEGDLVRLTSAENDVLKFLVSRSWAVCSRAEIAEVAHGDQSPARQRGVGVLVSRLRKKLETAGGPGAGQFLKTEPRRGFALVVDVAVL
jgi:DNA-binding response OmpR family regulator